MPLTTHFLLSKTFRTASDRLGVAKLPYRTHSHQRYPTPESCHIAITSPSSAHRFLPRFPHPTPSHPISPRAISLSLFKFRHHYLAQDDNEAHFHLTNIDRPRAPASHAVSVRHARIGGNHYRWPICASHPRLTSTSVSAFSRRSMIKILPWNSFILPPFAHPSTPRTALWSGGRSPSETPSRLPTCRSPLFETLSPDPSTKPHDEATTTVPAVCVDP
ncbi:hypothetical protein EDB85DRAFT_553024 [Lactarius pseudohatsudake]|nr:hypothetical protein EDB85DRAFT_553024 [Lactarius pseudohatsudake]